jgi:hypothetical protein
MPSLIDLFDELQKLIEKEKNARKILAMTIYKKYINAVKYKSISGEILPDENQFFSDDSKKVQINAWMKVARFIMNYKNGRVDEYNDKIEWEDESESEQESEQESESDDTVEDKIFNISE